MTDNSQESRKISRWRFCVAPMMEWTDRHCRFFHRLLSLRALIYTEMPYYTAIALDYLRLIHSSTRLHSNLVDVIRKRSHSRHVLASSMATTKSILTWGVRQIGCKLGGSVRV